MTENVENLLLEHMKRFQATLDSVQRDIRDLKIRQSETHTAVLALRRYHGANPSTVVLLNVAMFRPEKNQRELIDA
ncbi:MAG: hypothetical protein B7Z43_04840, partial [Sphingomonas sp. 12-62-6]